ncbi:MAG TPA: DUF3224 domain-containing protein [Devosiaceae bacterium]|jgi:hypothetical protein
MAIAKGTIKHNNWDEKPYHEANGQKSTTADIQCVFDGDLKAKAQTNFLMQYPNDKKAHYTGYLLVDGELGGKQGTFMIHEVGTWDGTAHSSWEIVEGSGTGALAGISGKGSYAAERDQSVHYTLTYDL